MTKHILKTNQGIPIPATLPHSIHSVGNTVSLHILIDNQLVSGEKGTDEVSAGESVDCVLSSASNVELTHIGTSLHDTHLTRCDVSLTIDSEKRGWDSTGRRRYFEVVRESTVLNLIWINERKVLTESQKCTQFVTGALSRDCRGAVVAFSTEADQGPWRLGIVHSLQYTNNASSNIDGLLCVYRWRGPTHQLENGMCVLESCLEPGLDFKRHFSQDRPSFVGGDSVRVCFLNQVCGLPLDRNSCPDQVVNVTDHTLQCSPRGPDTFPVWLCTSIRSQLSVTGNKVKTTLKYPWPISVGDAIVDNPKISDKKRQTLRHMALEAKDDTCAFLNKPQKK